MTVGRDVSKGGLEITDLASPFLSRMWSKACSKELLAVNNWRAFKQPFTIAF
jgi:hypothetical protein